MNQLEDRYIILKRKNLNDYQTEVIEQFIQSQHIKVQAGACVDADWPIYPAVEKMILDYAADPEGIEMLHAQHCPEASVAAVAVQVIGELHRMLIEGWAHDEKSVKMVMGTTAWLTSVLDGKAANPELLGGGFVNACIALDQSMIDEIDRCQHFLTDTLKQKADAESKALVSELYASWYLRLRDGRSGRIAVVDTGLTRIDGDELRGDELDAEMEDLDEPTAAMPPPEPDKPKKDDPLFDSFDDDVIF